MADAYSAVVFDLFGTLTGFEWQRRAQVALLADVFGVPADRLVEVMLATYDDRARGRGGSLNDQLEALARDAGANPTRAQMVDAMKVRIEEQRVLLQPRTGAVDVLRSIKSRGLKIGVLSDCTGEIPPLWPETPYAEFVDRAVFSCEMGTRKPDPKMYSEVLTGLQVDSNETLYVGDGGSRELSGALNVGMYPLLFAPIGEDHWRTDEEKHWKGASIADLSDVLAYLTDFG